MPRVLLLLGFMLLACSLLPAEPETTAPAAGAAERIAAILATMAPDNPAGWIAVEDALVQEGRDVLPALREALEAQQAALAKAQQPAEMEKPRLYGMALGAAITRVSWEWNPLEKIESWVSRLETKDGEPYALPRSPVFLADPTLGKTFPGYVFYAARCPDEKAPLPMRDHNLFAVRNDGALKHLANRHDLEAFFLAEVRAVGEDEEEAVTGMTTAWLRLTQEFTQDGALCFFTPAENLKAAYRTSTVTSINGWRASGQAVLTPGGTLAGDITVNLTFDAAGQLKTITEMRNLAQP
ncbi:MAG: hypothetical protein ACYC6A_23490 [Armatimonadota bacterium]